MRVALVEITHVLVHHLLGALVILELHILLNIEINGPHQMRFCLQHLLDALIAVLVLFIAIP